MRPHLLEAESIFRCQVRSVRDPGLLSDGVRVGHHIDDHGLVHGKRRLQRIVQIVGPLDPDADAAEGFRDPCEIHRRETPQFLAAAVRFAAVRRVGQVDLLIQPTVVVDDDDHVYVVALCALKLADVVVEPTIAVEAEDRLFRERAFHPERRRKSPPE